MIIPPGTCILRGASDRDSSHDSRYFAYYGPEKNANKFCRSKAFSSTYASRGYQYTKILKPFHLLNVPYPSLYMASEDDLCNGFQLCKSILDMIPTLPESPNFTKLDLTVDTINFLLNGDMDEYRKCLSPDDFDLYTQFLQIQSENKNSRNPDYAFEYVVCSLGYYGWLRRATSEDFVDSDEIMICSITRALTDGFLEYTDECNLASCGS